MKEAILEFEDVAHFPEVGLVEGLLVAALDVFALCVVSCRVVSCAREQMCEDERE